MRIERQRVFYSLSSAKLRRARRLYVRLIRASVMLDRTGNQLYVYARRMQDVGLYSPITQVKYIAYAILNRAYKTDVMVSKTHGIGSFTLWLRMNGWEGAGYCGFWRRGYPRPKLLPDTRSLRAAMHK